MDSSHPEPLDPLRSSARRRLLLRGGLKAAPLAMTLVGGAALGQTAQSSAARCLMNQPANPATVSGTNFVQVPVYRTGTGAGANSADVIRGADLLAVATAQRTTLNYTGPNGVRLDSTNYVVLRAGDRSPLAGQQAGNVVSGGTLTFTQTSSFVFVRIDAAGNVIGFFDPTNAAVGGSGGTALSASCQTSFAARP